MAVGVFNLIQNDLDQVYDLMLAELKSDQSSLDQIISYLLQKRGKMIRPALVILAGKICGGKSKELLPLGAAVEILHMATLIHDDIIDEAELRRGLTTVNKAFSSQVAVLLGDFFYARSLKILTRMSYHGFELVSNIVANLVQGEFMQYENSYKLDQGLSLYWQLINCKTAFFIANCCRLGAMASRSSREELAALAAYGKNLGMAFQIRDDLLDFTTDMQKLGKPTYKDVRNGVYTLPILHALQHAHEQTKLRDLLQKEIFTQRDYHSLLLILRKSGSLDYAWDKALYLCDLARQKLSLFSESREKEILESLTYFTIRRDF